MSEEETKQTTEGTDQGEPTPNSDSGSKPEASSPYEQAVDLVKRIEAGNREYAELLQRQEQLLARNLISGRSQAGMKSKSEDEKLEDEAKLFLDQAGY